MKLKIWHLFLVIVILFGCSFYAINLKFDKFYRVNGINNDNRILIEKHLDESEQEYLIENQISIDLFIDYLEYDDFQLQNYQYYNCLKDTKRYTTINQIIETGNNLVTRLTALSKSNAFVRGKMLIESSMEVAFLNEINFNFDYFEFYKIMMPLYDVNDYSYIIDTETYVSKLRLLGHTTTSELQGLFTQMTKSYTKSMLQEIMTAQLPEGVQIVFNPYEKTSLVNKTHYIGKYEPSGLILTQDIPRIRYAMYLQSNAYNALLKMYQDLNQLYSGFILMEAYQSPQSLLESEVGYTETQLGFTIQVNQTEIPYSEFMNTEMSKWLEEHSYEYGYILRYPNKKASITNKTYDSHTYRYVGVELAKVLHDSQMTLEEYVAK